MRTETRPWGRFEVMHEDINSWLKRIIIAPGQSLSLQYHQYREELWSHETPQDGSMAAYSLNGKESYLWPGTIVRVPRGAVHRLSNPCDVEVSVLEWALGRPNEDDIVRLDDLYGR